MYEEKPVRLLIEGADMERAEDIAAELTEALAEICEDGEDMANIVLATSMFWQIIFDFASGASESVH